MEPGQEFNYAGDAERVDDGSQVQVDGLFRVVEERRDDAGVRWLVEDARELEHEAGTSPELHRYLIAAQGSPAEPEPEVEDRPTE